MSIKGLSYRRHTDGQLRVMWPHNRGLKKFFFKHTVVVFVLSNTFQHRCEDVLLVIVATIKTRMTPARVIQLNCELN